MAMGKKWPFIKCKGVALLALFVIISGGSAKGFSADLLLFAGAIYRKPVKIDQQIQGVLNVQQIQIFGGSHSH